MDRAADKSRGERQWGRGLDMRGQEERARPLPVGRDEYLGVDVLAFERGVGWRLPVAAFELENSARGHLVAYALSPPTSEQGSADVGRSAGPSGPALANSSVVGRTR